MAMLLASQVSSIPTKDLRTDSIYGDYKISPKFKSVFDAFLQFAMVIEDDTIRDEKGREMGRYEPFGPFYGFSPKDFWLSQITGYYEAHSGNKHYDFFKSDTDKKFILEKILPPSRKITNAKTREVFYIIEGAEELDYLLATHSLDEIVPLRAGGKVPAKKILFFLEFLVSIGKAYINKRIALLEKAEETGEDSEKIRQFAQVTSNTMAPLDAKLTFEDRQRANQRIAEILRKTGKKDEKLEKE